MGERKGRKEMIAHLFNRDGLYKSSIAMDTAKTIVSLAIRTSMHPATEDITLEPICILSKDYRKVGKLPYGDAYIYQEDI